MADFSNDLDHHDNVNSPSHYLHGKKEKKPKKHKDEVLESKHQDLFDELFGDKS